MSWLGDARTAFELQQPAGLSGEGYTTVVTVPGAIRAAGANEALNFGGSSAVGHYVVTIRYRTDVRAEWRLKSGGRLWQLAGYQDPDGQREWLRVYCQEIQ